MPNDDVAPMPPGLDGLGGMPRPQGPDKRKIDFSAISEDHLESAAEIFDACAKVEEETDREMVAVERELAEVEARREYREREKIAKIPILGAAELENVYKDDLARAEGRTFNLGKWLPSLGKYRAIKPGELVTVVAGTSQGKTAVMVSLGMLMKNMTVLVFELELPPSDIWERMVSIDRGLSGEEVESAYKIGDAVASLRPFEHMWVCPLPMISPKTMKSIIEQSALKIGKRPNVVMVDYIQLLSGAGTTRYDKIAASAEALKQIARSTETIVIATSQRVEKRGDGDTDNEVYLHSAKGAGEIDNGAQWILGAWKNIEKPNTMMIKICKATRGIPGMVVECNFIDGATITERAKQEGPA